MSEYVGNITDDFLDEAAEYLKVMAHPARLRIALLLSSGEQPVHEIAESCQLRPSQACEHLRLLKRHGLLDSRRDGRLVYYRIVSQRLPRLLSCMQGTWRESKRQEQLHT